MTATTSAAAAVEDLANAVSATRCPGCGGQVAAGGVGLGRIFCGSPCRLAFNNRMKGEGAPLAAFVKTWAMTRHAKPGTDEAALCSYARSQMTKIAKTLNDRDAASGRPGATAYTATLMASGSDYHDRTRR